MVKNLQRTNISPVRATLCLALVACAVSFLFLQWRSAQRGEEYRVLCSAFPDVRSLESASIIAAERINDSCHRYYLAVPEKGLYRVELVLPDRPVDLGVIDASQAGRLIQFWIGLYRSDKQSGLNVYCEELSIDGLSVIDLKKKEGFLAGYSGSFTIAAEATDVRLSNLPENSTLLGEKAVLAYSRGLPVASIAMVAVAREEPIDSNH